MLIILSPSKTIGLNPNLFEDISTQPLFVSEAEAICKQLKILSVSDLQKILKTSPKLTQTAHDYYQHWNLSHSISNSTQAILAYKGDVFTGMDAQSFTKDTLLYSQQQLLIFSAIYGALRPLDLIQPYRLDVANPLKINGQTLYQYWKNNVTRAIDQQLKLQKDNILINLASAEYFQMLDTKQLKASIITPVFKDFTNGKYKIVSIFAKKARGKMSKFILENRISNPEELKTFVEDGYYFSESNSDEDTFTFLRG